MTLKLASGIALGVLVWLACLSPGIRSADVARADGPVGFVDPAGGSILQTYTFTYVGFQPYTRLTLSFLQPGATAFTIIDTPVPVVTNGLGQAQFPINLVDLIGDPSAALGALGPAAAQLAPLAGFAGLVNVSWGGPTPRGAFGSFRYDACDTVNCVDLVGTLSVSGP